MNPKQQGQAMRLVFSLILALSLFSNSSLSFAQEAAPQLTEEEKAAQDEANKKAVAAEAEKIRLAQELFDSQNQIDAGQEIPLKLKFDNDVKRILEVLLTSLVRRTPNVGNTSVLAITGATLLEHGLVAGSYNLTLLNKDDEKREEEDMVTEVTPEDAPKVVMNTQGDIQVALKTKTASLALVEVTLSGVTTSAEFLTSLETMNQAISTNSLLVSGEETLSTPDKAALMFDRLKVNLTEYLNRLAGVGVEVKKKTLFVNDDGSDAIDESEPVLPADVAAKLNVAIQAGFQVSRSAAGDAVLTMDTTQFKDMGQELAKVLPALAVVTTTENFQVTVSESITGYSIVSGIAVPMTALTTYDNFFATSQQQGGLGWLSDLVDKMGPWAVGRCTQGGNQAMCADMAMYLCPSTMGVDACVKLAQAAVITNEGKKAAVGAANAVGEGINQVGNGIGSLINNIFNPQPPPPQQ